LSSTEQPDGGAKQKKGGRPKGDESGIDYSRYRMNPVQVEESAEVGQTVPRRVGMYVAIVIVIAAAVLAVLMWNTFMAGRSAEQSPLKSLNPEIRERAQELVSNILTRIPSLQGYVYDVQYPTTTQLRVFINPTVLDKSGKERPIGGAEIDSAVERVTAEFQAYGVKGKRLVVLGFVTERPSEVESGLPLVVGTYDPQAESIRVTRTEPLPAYAYAAQQVNSTTLRVFVRPVVKEASGGERLIMDAEIERATQIATQDFGTFGPEGRVLVVETYAVDDPRAVEAQHLRPNAEGTYDPDTKSASVRLTGQITMPTPRSTGLATPGEGHIGERGGTGPSEQGGPQ